MWADPSAPSPASDCRRTDGPGGPSRTRRPPYILKKRRILRRRGRLWRLHFRLRNSDGCSGSLLERSRRCWTDAIHGSLRANFLRLLFFLFLGRVVGMIVSVFAVQLAAACAVYDDAQHVVITQRLHSARYRIDGGMPHANYQQRSVA